MGSVKIQLTAIGDLQNKLGKADVIFKSVNANLIEAKRQIFEADFLLKSVQNEAAKLLPMAKALGEKSLETQITKVIKDAGDLLKISGIKIPELK
jgi:hypothetical protein